MGLELVSSLGTELCAEKGLLDLTGMRKMHTLVYKDISCEMDSNFSTPFNFIFNILQNLQEELQADNRCCR
ncbi:hypothetical protein Leryth_025661 [Lithospermum erythrorhizon]|nr:hypothetical protein Leryth_025661 [Lithospermum erythrorhizon]